MAAKKASKLEREKVELGKRNTKGEYDDRATMKNRKHIPEKY